MIFEGLTRLAGRESPGGKGLAVRFADVQKILTTATFDETTSSLATLKPKFFLSEDAVEEVNLNKELQVVRTVKQFYLFFPLLYKDFYFVELLFSQLDRSLGEPQALSEGPGRKVVVFFNECKKCHYWYKVLRQLGLRVSVVHSYLKQFKRNANLLRFISGETEVLLATDLASRGLDLKNVHLVVNYDLPKNPKGGLTRLRPPRGPHCARRAEGPRGQLAEPRGAVAAAED